MTAPRVAVLIPCYNEEAAIAPTVRDFRASLPDAEIYVYDNNSTDQTIARAREAGAIVRSETRQGKGNVVRRQFADIDADVYVLVDGDDTYDASVAPDLVKKLIDESLDIVSGQRIATGQAAYRPGHVLGNILLTGLTALMFDVELKDMLTGYRIMSRRFVKSFPFTASGFAVETELTVHAVRLLVPMVEVETRYKERPAGSVSKLSTWGDGFRILFTIAALVREERPLIFFSGIFALLAIASLILGVPVIVFFAQHGTVPRLPTAILASIIMLLAFLALVCGLILDTVTRGRWEDKRMAYLAIPGPQDLQQK
ncbi:MAG TPA: glycosyltransferase family 2 protein [Rhizomicrobium sp.]|jgi:glycosyltransferase involved in cell wall biosynthesis|nr:glycosyltransferase family 2 protein [Rhizomicrobium sp.]